MYYVKCSFQTQSTRHKNKQAGKKNQLIKMEWAQLVNLAGIKVNVAIINTFKRVKGKYDDYYSIWTS